MTYGNQSATTPYYDIDRFTDKIPETLTTLKLGNEQAIGKAEAPLTEALFKNKMWLWLIMGLIILLLGWFSLKMIRKADDY